MSWCRKRKMEDDMLSTRDSNCEEKIIQQGNFYLVLRKLLRRVGSCLKRSSSMLAMLWAQDEFSYKRMYGKECVNQQSKPVLEEEVG